MDGEITTLYTLSATAPDLPVDRELIPRDVELNQIEEKLKNNTVVFVDGEEGIGVTTLLALFAHRHHFNCISYFYNDLVRTEAKPEFIKQSLSEQLHFYINKTTESEHELTWENLYAATLKKISSNKKHPLFFVFDGINFIPQEYREQIIQLFSTLPWNKAKFIFSGKDDDFKWLIQKKISSTSANQLLEFSKESCEKYLKNNIDNISEEDINELYQITRGVGKNISYILHKYKELNDIAPLLNKKDELLKDLYSMEIEHIRNLDDEQVYNLLCFITYCETKVTKDLLMAFMSINESNLNVLLQKIDRYLTINDDYISYKMPEFHKYMKTQLKNKEQDTLVQILKVYEKNITKYNDSILNLYNRSNQNENIITYLKSENVQHILEEERSHASYSLQCDYGFNAANKISGGKQNDKNIYICDAFRFAVSKSASREIEHNELWDFEIEALMANGEVEKAYTYAKSIYLVEEKLKNLILIVKEKQKLSKNMRDEILTEIKILIDFIKFEDIPEKSIELAKLLLSVDFTLSMTIIDKLIQHSQNKNFADKIYTIMSLSMDITKSDDDYNIAKYDDAFQSKIEDEGIRRMTNAMKSIFGNNSATEVISKINELSSSSQKIIFLQNWIPTHTDNKGIDQVIEYAIKLVISDSTIEVPKASVISEFTKALPNVSTKESFDKILLLINSVEDTIKTPTLDYTLIQLHIIESLSKFDSVKAYEILDDLYLNIDNLSDSSIKIDCLSLLLSHYKKLGINEEIEKKFITNTVLLAQIRNLIVSELTKTAYHYKLVETAIKTLVCKYHQFIHEIIPMLNTEYARSKAFLLAAIEYIKQIKLKDFDWDYLNSLIACIKVSTKDIDKPLVILAQKIHQSDYSDVLANKVKANFSNLFDKIHLDGNKCVVMAHLYIWFFKSDKHHSEFIFKKLYDIWQQLPYLWVKIGLGYQFATIFAKVDSQTSNQILHETFRISEGYIFSSTSNLYAYLESFDLYARSIGLLIRIGDCSDDVLKKFEIVMNKFKCNLFELSYWSRIALEYYIRKDAENFKKIFGSKVHEEYDKLQISDYNKQTLLLDVAPAFFLYSKDIFVDELKKQNDLFFQNSCINKICNFIFFKHPYIGDDDFRNCYFDLNDEDLENIFVLLDLCTDDALFLSIIETVCKSIDKNKGSLPIAQKKYRINKLKEIVNRKLPIKPNGIIHEGYKIACNAVIDSLTLNNKRVTWEKYIVDIETISNDADKAFLYFYISEFITNKDKQTEFIEKGFNLSNSLTSGYDKFSRFEMCLNECLVARDKMREYISKIGNAFKQSKQIDYSNNEHLIDIAYKHSEQMANLFIDILDQDEARRCHKAPILRHYDSLKRIEQANKDIKHIVKLKQNETIQFFSTQYNNLLNKKAIILDFYETAAVLKPIFDNNITVSKSAILYFMENTYQRHKISKNMNSTIWSIYESLVFNLNMVMALSTNTQDNLKMINCTMSRNFASNNSVIHPGERDKGLLYILDWFKDNQGSVLRIIDPYFSPKDIIELKPLFDIENRLNIKILTHAKVQELADYKEAWNNTYSNLTGSIDIITVCDKSKPDDGPLHDRYWIVSDRRKKLKAGLKLNSMSGLGNKEGDIERIPDEKIESIEDMWAYYYEDNISSINNKELKYSKIFIESEP